jgi:hypothetical protein
VFCPTIDKWGAKTGTRKKSVIALLLAVFVLLLTSTSSVKALESYSNILFGCEAKGPGLVIWGLVGMPTMSFGTYEYCAVFDKGDFGFAGASKVEVVEPPPLPGPTITTLLCYFKDGTVHAAGVLDAQWVHASKHYELTLMLWSTRQTFGAYVEMLSPPPNFVRMLDVGLDAAGCFDPKIATLSFLGILKVNGVRQMVSGRALAGILRATTETGEQSSIGVNLWVNELHIYAQIYWTSTIQQITLQPPMVPETIAVTVPAAILFKTYVKLS